MNIAMIPLRKGSKGIPGKNKKKLLGRPLFSWVLYEACKSMLDRVYVFTDDDEIIDYITKEYQWLRKISVIKRSEESATDTASTEYAIEEFLSKIDYSVTSFTLIQATSPLLTSSDIDRCISAITEEGYDSSITVAPFYRFLWSENGKPINYDYLLRPRRQDKACEYIENGACYSILYDQWLKTKNRLGGKIKTIVMPEESLTEIDEPSDFLVVEELLRRRLRSSKSKLISPKLLVLDVDGVLTDGNVHYGQNGEMTSSFSRIDGMGIENIRKEGIEIVVISSEESLITKARIDKLRIVHYFSGVKDKYSRLDDFLKRYNYTWSQVMYIGDDINDLTNINSSGVGLCPNNSQIEIKVDSDLVLHHNGGSGAVREAAELLLSLNRRT